MIVVKGGGKQLLLYRSASFVAKNRPNCIWSVLSSGKSESKWDPARACDEEAHGPPAESVRLERKTPSHFQY